MNDSNMTFDDLGVGMPPSVPNYRAGLLISKADEPRLIRDHIKREDIHKYVGKLVAKYLPSQGIHAWKVCKILEYNAAGSPGSTKFYGRDPNIEWPEHLKNFGVEYGSEVNSYIRNTCMPAPLRAVYSIIRTEDNVVYQGGDGDRYLYRFDLRDYDDRVDFFAELLGVNYGKS